MTDFGEKDVSTIKKYRWVAPSPPTKTHLQLTFLNNPISLICFSKIFCPQQGQFRQCYHLLDTLSELDFPGGSVGKESACDEGDLGSIPGLGRSPGEGKGYPLQYCGQENSIDSIVHGVAQSQTQLRDFHWLHFSELHLSVFKAIYTKMGAV